MNNSIPIFQEFKETLKRMIANYGIVRNPDGRRKNLEIILTSLKNAEFQINILSKDGHADIVVAKRPAIDSNEWVGLYGHYDVEPIDDGWLTDPLVLTEKDGRLFGRGIGDNLGPLVLRLYAALQTKTLAKRPGLIWLLQGEEEIASPFAHEAFPKIQLPEVKYWLEETGYFNTEKGQRILTKNTDSNLEILINEVSAIGKAQGFDNYVENRYMNKAFGEHQCPYLNHIVKSQPYLAIGPNDEFSNIHRPNESLPIYTFEVSFLQFIKAIS